VFDLLVHLMSSAIPAASSFLPLTWARSLRAAEHARLSRLSVLENLASRARCLPTHHITVRVPWHDRSWGGTVCATAA
jgi:hypothetical protein